MRDPSLYANSLSLHQYTAFIQCTHFHTCTVLHKSCVHACTGGLVSRQAGWASKDYLRPTLRLRQRHSCNIMQRMHCCMPSPNALCLYGDHARLSVACVQRCVAYHGQHRFWRSAATNATPNVKPRATKLQPRQPLIINYDEVTTHPTHPTHPTHTHLDARPVHVYLAYALS